jgi:hypothetical protein
MLGALDTVDMIVVVDVVVDVVADVVADVVEKLFDICDSLTTFKFSDSVFKLRIAVNLEYGNLENRNLEKR